MKDGGSNILLYNFGNRQPEHKQLAARSGVSLKLEVRHYTDHPFNYVQ
jgi:hypothetical protein